jgi:hypothetical protein
MRITILPQKNAANWNSPFQVRDEMGERLEVGSINELINAYIILTFQISPGGWDYDNDVGAVWIGIPIYILLWHFD